MKKEGETLQIYSISKQKLSFQRQAIRFALFLNKHEKVHQIVVGQNDASAPTGFFHLANSMIVHNNYVYIQGDVRVRGFNLDNLECIDTLHIPKDIIKKSAIAI